MRNAQELKDFKQAANSTVCSLLSALLDKAEETILGKMATAKLAEIENLQGRIAAYRALKRLIAPAQSDTGEESGNSYL